MRAIGSSHSLFVYSSEPVFWPDFSGDYLNMGAISATADGLDRI